MAVKIPMISLVEVSSNSVQILVLIWMDTVKKFPYDGKSISENWIEEADKIHKNYVVSKTRIGKRISESVALKERV